MTDEFIHPCCVCGADDAPFGYDYFSPEKPSRWFCREHDPDPTPPPADAERKRKIDEWVEANWPKVTDPKVCRHCGGQNDGTLVPIGYGPRPLIWTHRECYEDWVVSLECKAAKALGLAPPESASEAPPVPPTPPVPPPAPVLSPPAETAATPGRRVTGWAAPGFFEEPMPGGDTR